MLKELIKTCYDIHNLFFSLSAKAYIFELMQISDKVGTEQ